MNLRPIFKLLSRFILAIILYLCWQRYLSPDFNDLMLASQNHFLELLNVYYGWIVFVHHRIILPKSVDASLGKERESVLLALSYSLVLVPRILLYLGYSDLAKIVFLLPMSWIIISVLKTEHNRKTEGTSLSFQDTLKGEQSRLMIIPVPIAIEYCFLVYNARIKNVNVMNLGYFLAFFVGVGSLFIAFSYRTMLSSITFVDDPHRLSMKIMSWHGIKKTIVFIDLAVVAVLGPLVLGTLGQYDLPFWKGFIFLFLPFLQLGVLSETLLLIVLSFCGVVISAGVTRRWFASLPRHTILEARNRYSQHPNDRPTIIEYVLTEIAFVFVRAELFFIVPWLLLRPDVRGLWTIMLGCVVLAIYQSMCKKFTRSFAVYGLITFSSAVSIWLSAVLEITHICYRRHLIMNYK